MTQVILRSDDALFAASFAESVKQELGYGVVAVGAENLPSISFAAGTPRRIADMLREVTLAVRRHATEGIWLAAEVLLLDTQRRLCHPPSQKSVDLTEKEQALLLYIYRKNDISRSDLLQAAWGLAADIDTHTLETHIYRLRQKWRELIPVDCIKATETGYSWIENAA